MSTIIEVTFKLGQGKMTLELNRAGTLIERKKITTSDKVTFAQAQVGDDIDIDGDCTGNTEVKINCITKPTTPQQYPPGAIFDDFEIKSLPVVQPAP